MQIRPKISQDIQNFIQSQDMFALKKLHEGVIHIAFPDQINKNINRIKTVFDNYGVDLKIYFAHKSTKNKAFVKEARKADVCIDVSSKNELISALSCGFSGDKILCNGPKNDEFIRLALFHSCQFSLDSLQELNRLIDNYKLLNLSSQISVLIRINNPQISDRNIAFKDSRFGSVMQQLDEFYNQIKLNKFIDFKGLHFHGDGYDPSMKASILQTLIEALEDSFSRGFSPDTVNLGGSLSEPTLESYSDWSNYLELLEKNLLNNKKLPIWGNNSYGLFVNANGKIGGKDRAISRFNKSYFDKDLDAILATETSKGRMLADILNDNMFSVALEPGYALLQQAGITLVEVIEIKQASDGRNLLVLDANLYNLGVAKMFQLISDPVLIPCSNKANNQETPYSVMVVGNLCREDDFLIEREVYFDQKPCSGDILVFTNTAPYFAGFEDATPIMHPKSKFLVAYKQKQEWKITIPEKYNPFEL